MARVRGEENGDRQWPRLKRRVNGRQRAWRMHKETLKLQSQEKCLIPKATFARVLKDIGKEMGKETRWRKSGKEALQVAMEKYMTDIFTKAMILMIHRGKRTLVPGDIHVANHIMHDAPLKMKLPLGVVLGTGSLLGKTYGEEIKRQNDEAEKRKQRSKPKSQN